MSILRTEPIGSVPHPDYLQQGLLLVTGPSVGRKELRRASLR
ncbi:hypothetical protein [Spirosoma fluviale]|nr:hypothetical protein [Spirosoma fluviale]